MAQPDSGVGHWCMRPPTGEASEAATDWQGVRVRRAGEAAGRLGAVTRTHPRPVSARLPLVCFTTGLLPSSSPARCRFRLVCSITGLLQIPARWVNRSTRRVDKSAHFDAPLGRVTTHAAAGTCGGKPGAGTVLVAFCLPGAEPVPALRSLARVSQAKRVGGPVRATRGRRHRGTGTRAHPRRPERKLVSDVENRWLTPSQR